MLFSNVVADMKASHWAGKTQANAERLLLTQGAVSVKWRRVHWIHLFCLARGTISIKQREGQWIHLLCFILDGMNNLLSVRSMFLSCFVERVHVFARRDNGGDCRIQTVETCLIQVNKHCPRCLFRLSRLIFRGLIFLHSSMLVCIIVTSITNYNVRAFALRAFALRWMLRLASRARARRI